MVSTRVRPGDRHQYVDQSLPLRQRIFRTAERGGLSRPQPHRPGTHPRRRPHRAGLYRTRLALGWLLEDAGLPTLRAALSYRPRARAAVVATSPRRSDMGGLPRVWIEFANRTT